MFISDPISREVVLRFSQWHPPSLVQFHAPAAQAKAVALSKSSPELGAVFNMGFSQEFSEGIFGGKNMGH